MEAFFVLEMDPDSYRDEPVICNFELIFVLFLYAF